MTTGCHVIKEKLRGMCSGRYEQYKNDVTARQKDVHLVSLAPNYRAPEPGRPLTEIQIFVRSALANYDFFSLPTNKNSNTDSKFKNGYCFLFMLITRIET